VRKERFPELRKSKLQPRGGCPFQLLETINDNTSKVLEHNIVFTSPNSSYTYHSHIFLVKILFPVAS